MPRPSVSFLFDHPINICWAVLLNFSIYIYIYIYISWFPFNWSLWSPNILKHPQPTFFPQCQFSTLPSFVRCSLYPQKWYNHLTLLRPSLLAFLSWGLNFNSGGHKALYIITYDDVTEQSVSCSEVICLESCWMFWKRMFSET
jgi:hypothetical protein